MGRSWQWHQESLKIKIERARLAESCSCNWLHSAECVKTLRQN